MNAFYLVAGVGILIQTVALTLAYKKHALLERFWFSLALYISDIFLVTGLLWYTQLQDSLFLFIYLVLILLSGLSLGLRQSFIVASVISLSFSITSAAHLQIHSLNFFFMMILNNVAFFFVAYLSGRLGQDLRLYKNQLNTKDINLAAEKKLNELILESVSVGLLAVNKKFEILVRNQSARKILASVGTLKTDQLSEVFDFLKNIDLLELNEQFSAETSIQLKDAEDIRFYRISINPEQSQYFEEPVWIFSIEDITDLKELEYSSRQSEKMAAIGGLAAGIAHEIRNPLASISGSVQMLSQSFTTDDDRKLGKIVIKEIDRLNRLISEFLDFSKPENPPSTLIQLSDLCQEVVSIIKNQNMITSNGKSIQIDQQLEPVQILGSWDKLKQALLNIVMNSIQAMDQQLDPRILISCKKANEDEVEVVIQDNGCGMTEKTKQKMFEAFHTTKPKGTGLGLAITHKILQAHDAHIWVTSDVGIGTKFYIRFPLKSFDLERH